MVSFHATVANYEYLVYWRFYQDGNIECEVRATGIMVTTHFPEGEQPPYGTLVDERTYAPFHQHFIVARLDLDIDGERNTVQMTESEALPIGPDNPDGLALVQRSVPLRTEQDGMQDYDWHTQRAWKVVNEAQTNGLGTPVGYKLVPTGCFPAMIDPSSAVFRRAQAIGHNAVGDAVRARRALAVRRVPRPERGGLRPAGLDRRRTARSRTRTSSSGTCSASTT